MRIVLNSYNESSYYALGFGMLMCMDLSSLRPRMIIMGTVLNNYLKYIIVIWNRIG